MFLRNLWYFAMPAEALKPGAMQRKVLLGEPILIGREADGTPFALRDLCPHRGVPLSAGRLCHPGTVAVGTRFTRTEVECPYHGWRFRTDGHCSAIPSLLPDQAMDIDKIRVQSYPVADRQGNLWVFMGAMRDGPLAETPLPPTPPPLLPEMPEEARPRFREAMTFACHVDHAVIGLMDPAHGPFVHRSWWWRSEASIHAKAKAFVPSPLGFTMVAHAPSKNSGAYKILGGAPTTEITFNLPGLRTELIRIGTKRVLGLTTVTPLEAEKTEVTQTFYWTLPWLDLVRPFFRPFARSFLKQDHDMVMLQREGLKFNPRLMLINDADIQAKWYFRLKKDWADATETGRPFENTIEPVTLRWRS